MSVAECLVASQAPSYGSVQGSSADWARANFKDRGRTHLDTTTSELASSGLKQWYTASAPPERPFRRHLEQASSAVCAEPSVQGGHRTYYGRRSAPSTDPSAVPFRRSLRYVAPPDSEDRPEGKRAIPEPYGPPPRSQGLGPCPEVAHRPSGTYPEPSLPRLARPAPGITGLRETEQEYVFEQTLGRKVRVGYHNIGGQGRAGDMSLVYGAPKRVEEIDPTLVKTLKDSPTFLRFCNSLPPKPAVSPHARRTAELQRQRQAETAAEQNLVATLTLPAAAGDDD